VTPIAPTPAPVRDEALAQLQCRFPGIPVWFGNFTRHWWAVFGDRLFEATTAASSSCCSTASTRHSRTKAVRAGHP
jgi:hypothetical protein